MYYVKPRKEFPDLRKPYGFRTKPVPYLRRPESFWVVFSYELMRMCAAICIVLVALMFVLALSGR